MVHGIAAAISNLNSGPEMVKATFKAAGVQTDKDFETVSVAAEA